MKLSVIIPVYKVEDTLQKCVRSVVMQGVPDMEVILVDDGGLDKCPEMCDNLARLYNHESEKYNGVRVIVIHKVNEGLSCARNSGIDAATGDYITFVDSDDFLGENTYQKVMKFVDIYPEVDIFEFGVAERYDSPILRSVLQFKDKIYDDVFKYWFETEAYKHTYAWNKIYRSELFEKVRFPEGMAFEDVYVLPQLLDNSKMVATLNVGTYFYSWNEEGITATAGRRELTEHLIAGVRSLKWVPEKYHESIEFVKLYADVLNTQINLFARTNGRLSLPRYEFRVSLLCKAYKSGLQKTSFIKLLMLKYMRLRNTCKIWQILLKFRKDRF